MLFRSVLKSSGYQVAEYVQKDATENNLKSSHGLTVLHIATHGFFFPDVEKASWPIGVHADNAKDNVLLRSGLVLTGVMEGDKLNPTMDSVSNGVMTSYEAMNLDLKGTKLVVLSACETGLGEVQSGEGVSGLRQAFQLAGAKAVVSTLWKVPDKQSARLMALFFQNLSKSMSKSEALRAAKLKIIAERRDDSAAAHPFFWAAFTLTGEPCETASSGARSVSDGFSRRRR